MRVAWLTALFPVLSEIPFLNQIVGLVERGHEVAIYADGPQPGGPFHPDVARLGLESRTRYPVRWPAGSPPVVLQAAADTASAITPTMRAAREPMTPPPAPSQTLTVRLRRTPIS